MFDSSSSYSSNDESKDRLQLTEDEKRKLHSKSRRRPSKIHEKSKRPTDSTRREENPFSFKHFLKNETQSSHQYAGARPKLFSMHSANNESENHIRETGVFPCNPTELPDFVQDHLVLEQSFAERDRVTSPATSVDNLPDFALNSMERRKNRHSNDSILSDSQGENCFRFDIRNNPDSRSIARASTSHSGPLDLPNFSDNNNQNPSGSESRGDFPFDLQLSQGDEVDVHANSQLNGASNIVKSLPDFLSDGPIRNKGITLSDRINMSSDDPPEVRLTMENERLLRELEILRSQSNERAARIQTLESQLLSRRREDQEETINLEKAMERVEDNLKRSTRRAVHAENSVANLKKEVSDLNNEILILRSENRELRAAIGGQCGSNSNNPGIDERMKKLADDLRNAASTAEVSLRQLMSGVGNLRVLASALENIDRLEDRTKDFSSDSDDDNATGPAL